jgi:hypothetical protein
MSGIIGGAGSKSGVIGETEIDYEEGTWTPNLKAFAHSITSWGWYRKIGNMVFADYRIDQGAGTDTSHYTINQLPFTVRATGYNTSGSTIGFANGTSTNFNMLVINNTDEAEMNSSTGAGISYTTYGNGRTLRGTLIYETS